MIMGSIEEVVPHFAKKLIASDAGPPKYPWHVIGIDVVGFLALHPVAHAGGLTRLSGKC